MGQSSALYIEWVASLPLAGTESVQLSVTHAATAAGLVLPALVAARRSSDVRSTALAGRPPSSSVQGKPHCGEMPAIAGSRHRGARAASSGRAPPGAPPTAKGRQPVLSARRAPGPPPSALAQLPSSDPSRERREPAKRSGGVGRERQG